LPRQFNRLFDSVISAPARAIPTVDNTTPDSPEPGAALPPKPPRPGLFHRLRTKLMAGVTVIAPLWITGWVLWTLFGLAEQFSRPLIKPFLPIPDHPQWYYRGFGFLITVLLLLIVGTVTTNVLTRRVLHDAREALERLPIVRTIYSPVRKLMETMTSPDSAGFKQVVLFEYPRRGTWTLGFLAGDVPFEDASRQPAHSIFIPTAPNPTTGFMLIVPVEDIRPTSLSIEAAFQMIVSAGVAVPLALKLPADVAIVDGTLTAERSTG
jgi:uncharacterized membrane protein